MEICFRGCLKSYITNHYGGGYTVTFVLNDLTSADVQGKKAREKIIGNQAGCCRRSREKKKDKRGGKVEEGTDGLPSCYVCHDGNCSYVWISFPNHTLPIYPGLGPAPSMTETCLNGWPGILMSRFRIPILCILVLKPKHAKKGLAFAKR